MRPRLPVSDLRSWTPDQVQMAPIVATRFFHASENHQRSPKLSRRHLLWT